MKSKTSDRLGLKAHRIFACEKVYKKSSVHECQKVASMTKYKKPTTEELKKSLTDEQFHITQNCGTERAFANGEPSTLGEATTRIF
jgi:hypothetical protein